MDSTGVLSWVLLFVVFWGAGFEAAALGPFCCAAEDGAGFFAGASASAADSFVVASDGGFGEAAALSLPEDAARSMASNTGHQSRSTESRSFR